MSIGSADDNSIDPSRSVIVGVLRFDALTEQQAVDRIVRSIAADTGGWVVTPNADILRVVTADGALAQLVDQASLVLADGMPLLWAAKLAGTPLPERVTGSSLIFSLSEALSHAGGGSIYLLGGDQGVPEAAARTLQRRYPGLQVVGTDSPSFGFDQHRDEMDAVVARVVAAQPKVVFVGLGFPKQERLILALRHAHPTAWYIGCGAAIPVAAGVFRRAPQWAQRAGVEWVYRLLAEPRRLAYRYLVDDAPFAIWLLAHSIKTRLFKARTAISDNDYPPDSLQN